VREALIEYREGIMKDARNRERQLYCGITSEDEKARGWSSREKLIDPARQFSKSKVALREADKRIGAWCLATPQPPGRLVVLKHLLSLAYTSSSACWA
jgi:hypothetical protein